ncbi:hypothetical protein OG506_21445 [Streptomyces sp. NBC_00696]|nr:hypothetical protein [Streptomyces sp. NBC_00696]
MAGGDHLAEHRDADGELAAQADAHDQPTRQQGRVVQRDGAEQAAQGVDEEIDAERGAAAIAVGDPAARETADQAADHGEAVDRRQFVVADVQGRLDEAAHRPYGVLLQGVEEHPGQDDHEDPELGAGEAGFVQGPREGVGRRAGRRRRGELRGAHAAPAGDTADAGDAGAVVGVEVGVVLSR